MDSTEELVNQLTEKVNIGNRLLEDKGSLLNAVRMAKSADNYDVLLLSFRRARKEDYLGDIEIIKAAFVLECEKEIKAIDDKIIELWAKSE